MRTDVVVTRRTALKFAGLITLAARGWGPGPLFAGQPGAHGYGADPDLSKRSVTWSRTLSAQQLAALAALGDIVLPADDPYPSARALGVHEFLDEWVSAPYPQMQADRTTLLEGLASLDVAMRKRRGVPYAQADLAQQTAVFDESCGTPATAEFARRLIELICAGYYTTRDGHAAIGYVGNVPLAKFPAPSPVIIRHLEQALSKLPARSGRKT